ncbi:MAG: hypothetical protein IT497_10835 [Ottowia sp.]|nr:hypothetical protein [Ottowia sp.]
MSIQDFGEKIISGWKILLGFVLSGLVLAYLFLTLCPPEYEASIGLKIGTTASGKPIESMASITTRLRSTYMLRTLLQQSGMPPSDSNVKQLIRTIRIRPIDEDTLQLSMRAENQQQTIDKINKLANELIDQHAELNGMSIALRKQVNKTDTAVTTNIARTKRSQSNATADPMQPDNESCICIMESRLNKNANLRTTRAQPTKITFPADVSEQPVFPNHAMIYILAILLGLVCGVIWIFSAKAIKDTK